MIGGVPFREGGFEGFLLGEVEGRKCPCAEASCVAHGTTDEVSLSVNAVGEESEGGFSGAPFFHDAQGGTGADVDGGEAGFGCAGAKVAGCSVADAWEPRNIREFGEHFGERTFDGSREIVDWGQRDGVEVAGFQEGGFPAESGGIENAGARCHSDGAGGALGEFGLKPFGRGQPERDGFENGWLRAF